MTIVSSDVVELANHLVAVYPGLVESIDAKDYANGLRWAGIIGQCVSNAIKSIE